jgi:hypothetical protein
MKELEIQNVYNKWRARISFNKKRIHLGVFTTPELAAEAYNKAAREYHGGIASLNII